MALASGWKTMAAMLAGGAIGVALAPALRPALGRYARPAAKAGIRAGLLMYQRGRVAMAELREATEDMAAEVKAERAAEPAPAPRPPETVATGSVH